MRMLTTTFLCGCAIEPFETPSAYDQQRYLCDDRESLQAAADACRKEPEPCSGYISFQGRIQLVQLRVDTTLERGMVHLVDEKLEDTGAGPQEVVSLSRVELSGAAPYFHFDVAISSIGTDWPEYPHGTRTDDELTFGTPDPETALVLDDEIGAVQWYIRAGSDTAMLSSNPDTKSVILVTYLSETQVDLEFAGGFGPVNDTLAACAIVFPEPVLAP